MKPTHPTTLARRSVWIRTAAALACLVPALMLQPAPSKSQTASSEALSSERLEQHLASFDEVRSTIEARYPKPERLDQAWHALADSLREAVPSTTSDREARQILSALAESFGESHFQIVPAESYDTLYETDEDDDGGQDAEDEDSDGSGDSETGEDAADEDPDEGDDEDEDDTPTGSSGVSVRLIDGSTVVTRVQDGSAGEAAGLRPGDELVKVGSRTTAFVVETIRTLSAGSPNRIETTVAAVLQSRLTGDIGDTLTVEYVRTPGDTLAHRDRVPALERRRHATRRLASADRLHLCGRPRGFRPGSLLLLLGPRDGHAPSSRNPSNAFATNKA